MLKLLTVLAILEAGSSLRVITRNMIRTPEDRGLVIEYQPVRLRTKEPAVARSLEPTTTEVLEEPTEPPTTLRTTLLYPVGGLWQDRQLLEPDLWGILRNAYYCLFAGFDCFSSRVFPLVKSYIGYQPHYPFPRDSQLGQEEDKELMKKMAKEVLLGLLLVSLPWLGGVGLASGRALVSSLLTLGTRQPYYM